MTTNLTIDLLPDASGAMCGAALAYAYHGGQFTALYAVASSGSLELRKGEGTGRLLRELREAIAEAEESENLQDIEDLQDFHDYIAEHYPPSE